MEFMSLDVLQEIQNTAVAAAGSQGKVSIVDASALGEGQSLIVKPNGDYDLVQSVAVRSESIRDLKSVCTWTNYAISSLAAKPVVWVRQDSIVVVFDDTSIERPRASAVCKLRATPEYALIKKLAADSSQFGQKEFVGMLRRELWDCLDINKRDDWIKILRTLQSREGQTGRAEIGLGRQSLGRELEEEVTSSIGEIPETLTLMVRLFLDPALQARQAIVCELDVNPSTFKFSLLPVKSDLAEALENEIEDITKFLQNTLPKDVPIFQGA